MTRLAEPHSPMTKKLIEAGLRASTIRQDEHGPMRLLAACEGYVMVRRGQSVPFVIRADVWLRLKEAA